MSPNPNDGTADSCRLHRFEKNRYFHGKLMTARDLEAEQQYHVGRQRTLTRHVTGEGLLCGLEVSVDEDDVFEISVGQGLAVDCCGNPIVVKNTATEELDPPSGDEIYVHLTFDECSKESVPIPGSENACEQECAYNRVLEIFEITYEEDPPEFKTVPDTVEYPDSDDVDDDEDDALAMMARSYYDGTLSECETCDDPSVFIGAFTRSNGEWTETTPDRRPFVYTNDMLYAALARHVADFENPHEVTAAQTGAIVSVDGVANPGGNVDLVSTGSVLIEPDDDANEIGFEATAESVGALASVDGVENPGGDVDLASPDDTVAITPDDNANTIELQTSAAALGALMSVDGVENPGGNVDLTSSDDSIAIDPDEDANAVDLRVSDDIQGRFEEFEEQLGELKSEFEAEIESLRGRLEPLEQYVMDKTLKYKRDVFTGVAERFDTGIAQEIVEFTEEAISEEVFRDRETYFDFLQEAAELEQQLVDELEGQATEGSLERFAQAIQRLIDTLDEEEQVVAAAVEQDFVCETAERLTGRQE